MKRRYVTAVATGADPRVATIGCRVVCRRSGSIGIAPAGLNVYVNPQDPKWVKHASAHDFRRVFTLPRGSCLLLGAGAAAGHAVQLSS